MSLKHLMNEYFNREEQFYQRTVAPRPDLLREDVPIVARDAFDWEIENNPNRLVKKFKFQSAMAQRSFIGDLLEYEEEIGHNAEIIISGDSITIEVYTHYIEDITEVDQEYASTADEIYKDSNDVVDE
jgi:4a-hydroxytetrahydrobiopterin dehydratase